MIFSKKCGTENIDGVIFVEIVVKLHSVELKKNFLEHLN